MVPLAMLPVFLGAHGKVWKALRELEARGLRFGPASPGLSNETREVFRSVLGYKASLSVVKAIWYLDQACL